MAGMTPFAAALAAARALNGRTWADARVLLEPEASIDVTAPTICVYGVHSSSTHLRCALWEARHCRLRIELLLPLSVQATNGTTVWTLDLGASAALAFGLFWRQCEIALQSDQSAWANVYRALVANVSAIERPAAPLMTKTASVIAARAFELVGDPVNAPRIGVQPDGVWADLLAAMRGDSAELASLADLVASVIGGAPLGDWQSDFAILGQSQSHAPALGLAPDGDVDNQPGAANLEAPSDPTLNDPQV
jgi:hypothetical protein